MTELDGTGPKTTTAAARAQFPLVAIASALAWTSGRASPIAQCAIVQPDGSLNAPTTIATSRSLSAAAPVSDGLVAALAGGAHVETAASTCN